MDQGMEDSVLLPGIISLWYSGGHYILVHSNVVQKSLTAVIGVGVGGGFGNLRKKKQFIDTDSQGEGGWEGERV